jgi:hypothetical protein
MSKKFGRPSQGRDKRLQASISEEVLKWLEKRAYLNQSSVSDVAFSILNGAMLKEQGMIKLEYNSQSEMYEAHVDGKHVEVNPDIFSEEINSLAKSYLEEGKAVSEEHAKDKAWEELICASEWMNGIHGAFIDGKVECSCCQ